MSHTPQSRHKRAASPPLSVAGSSQFTTTPQSKLNVVTRLALEGKAKHSDDGATVRMYLKLSIPMDSVSPGSTASLFPEENLKLLSAQVHPLDSNFSPYTFSPTSFPNLNNAARALHLPALSQKSYLSVFGLSTSPTTPHSGRASSSTASSVASNIPPLDEKYTGHIIVSGYNISYILPKEFPPRFNGGGDSISVQRRRPSIGERNNMHFMAALEVWIPYVSRPPKAPFLISVPVPRCLSNSIKLRIHPPTIASASSSMASLSSAEEDPGAWELASEPYVARNVSRSGSSADMADDESSDSSTYTDGSSGGILVQGTFPSTERLRVRWAQPTKNLSNNDGRRRVGVREAQGDITAAILGRAQDPHSGREGILMRLEYKGTCKGIWFPGVATMLGLDIGLEVKNADAVWPSKEDANWTITGGAGYTGFDVGQPSPPVSRQLSLEFPTGMSTSSMLYTPPVVTPQEYSSTSSLLRAPLPQDHLPDYTFESSPTSLTPSGTLSSVGSLPPTSEGRSSLDGAASSRSPAVPITVHINMNDIIPPSKNVFTFSITGTILLLPRFRYEPPTDLETDPVVLPRFCVLATDSEKVSTIIRNETENNIVEIYYISGDPQDAQTRKAVLQRNGINRCGNDGARIALRSISRASPISRAGEQAADNKRLSPQHTPLNRNKVALAPLSLAPALSGSVRRKSDAPVMIAAVRVVVTPLFLDGTSDPGAHAVRVHVHAPSDPDSDYLEFGIAQAVSSSFEEGWKHQIDIISVSIDNIPVRFESSVFAERSKNHMIDLALSRHEKTRHGWITWVKVQGGNQGGLVTVDYIARKVGNPMAMKGNTKGKNFDVLMPTFALPVGRLEVTVEVGSEVVKLMQSNFAHQQKCPDGYRFLHHSLDQFSTPTLSFAIGRRNSRTCMRWLLPEKLFLLFLWISPALLVFLLLTNLTTEIKQMQRTLNHLDVAIRSSDRGENPAPSTETIIITTTIFSSLPSATVEPDDMKTPFSSSVSIPTTASIDPTPSPSDLSTRDQSRTDIPTFTSNPAPPSSPPTSEISLITIPPFPYEWSNIRINLPLGAQQTVDKVLEGMGIVWQLFRKAYHYPLDPP